jgi:hypothetical protein
VNQIRFLSSSDFPMAEKLMFAASCSAADAMKHSGCAGRRPALFIFKV